MGTAFTDSEITAIRERLKREGRECLARFGIRKTTVDQLSVAAGISTGAFYRFYDSKELLFFEIIEDMHEEMYGRALRTLRARVDLPQAERMELAILQFFEQMKELSVASVWESDMDYLLRKIPEETLRDHWSDDRTHLRELIVGSGLKLTVGPDEATAILWGITLMLPGRRNFPADEFDRTIRFIVRAVCKQLDGDKI